MEKNKEMQDQLQKAHEQAKNFIKEVPCEQIVKNLSFWLDVMINKGRYLDIEEAQNRQKDGVPSSTKDSE